MADSLPVIGTNARFFSFALALIEGETGRGSLSLLLYQEQKTAQNYYFFLKYARFFVILHPI
jgi:hypothetical protein